MSHIFSTKKPKSAIDMSRYGIGVVVLTEHEGMDKLVFDFEHKPDQVWCGGKGEKVFSSNATQATNRRRQVL